MHTSSTHKRAWLLSIWIVVLIVIDQVIKILVKTQMTLGQDIRIFDWFHIYFIENPGMAYGITILNKMILILFRLIMMGVLIYIIHRLLVKKKSPLGFLLCLSAIVAGGIGNLIDGIFYAKIFPLESGAFFEGNVVDMLYFPLLHGHFPSWVPIWGGEDFIFFRPVFNIADSCITVGVIAMILFYRKALSKLLSSSKDQEKDKSNQQQQ